jgi:NAD(P)-dependent dehydrogenase (short-subunit alcohol dehydrogenase family)
MKKTILITGTSSGFGKLTAQKFAADGWNVIATMRSPEKETELTQLDNVLVTKLDVQDIDSIQQAIDAGIQRFGKIDTLVNNAGFGMYGIFELATREQIRAQFDVNVFGVMDTIQAILPHFRANNGGTIINISSQGGRITYPAISLYHASKFAIEGFSESVSFELAPLNIIVKLIEPGAVNTSFGNSATFTANPAITVYDEFMTTYAQNIGKLTPPPSEPEVIVEVIYTAATDGTNQLRYIAGEDAKLVIGVKQSVSDREYMHYMTHRYKLDDRPVEA